MFAPVGRIKEFKSSIRLHKWKEYPPTETLSSTEYSEPYAPRQPRVSLFFKCYTSKTSYVVCNRLRLKASHLTTAFYQPKGNKITGSWVHRDIFKALIDPKVNQEGLMASRWAKKWLCKLKWKRRGRSKQTVTNLSPTFKPNEHLEIKIGCLKHSWWQNW